MMAHKKIKREKNSLSHTRFNKMKVLIMSEMKDAIREAQDEPSASINDINMIQSIISQNEKD